MKIYVGNLPFDATEEELRNEFGAYGKVQSASIITDKVSGTARGFAFVEMTTISEGQAAINGLNGKVIRERTLTVNAAKERTPDRGGSYNNNRGGGSRGGGYGGNSGGKFSGGRQRRY